MKTHSSSSHNVREFRRLRAIELFEEGWKAINIAKALGVTRGAVSQWFMYIPLPSVKEKFEKTRFSAFMYPASLNVP